MIVAVILDLVRKILLEILLRNFIVFVIYSFCDSTKARQDANERFFGLDLKQEYDVLASCVTWGKSTGAQTRPFE